MANTQLNISLSTDLKQQLQKAVEITQKNEQQLIVEALEKHLAELTKPQNCYDLALKLGVIGVAENFPSDLSTNPDYFTRFGNFL
ncbi:MAG: hypothetical protein J7647_05110 [Cyanobacteria bacterium SBLK]|nr:hypothetical protein [Cyanobacteria bacterium SBLK]